MSAPMSAAVYPHPGPGPAPVLAASVLPADPCRLGDELRAVEAAGVDRIQWDVMPRDGTRTRGVSTREERGRARQDPAHAARRP